MREKGIKGSNNTQQNPGSLNTGTTHSQTMMAPNWPIASVIQWWTGGIRSPPLARPQFYSHLLLGQKRWVKWSVWRINKPKVRTCILGQLRQGAGLKPGKLTTCLELQRDRAQQLALMCNQVWFTLLLRTAPAGDFRLRRMSVKKTHIHPNIKAIKHTTGGGCSQLACSKPTAVFTNLVSNPLLTPD